MDSLIFELQIVFYFQLFLSPNVRHTNPFLFSVPKEKKNTGTIWRKFSTEISVQMVSAHYVEEEAPKMDNDVNRLITKNIPHNREPKEKLQNHWTSEKRKPPNLDPVYKGPAKFLKGQTLAQIRASLTREPRNRASFWTANNRAIFVSPWNERGRTKQKQQTNGNRAIWLVYRTDTSALGYWLVKRTLGWKNFMPENFLEINRYFASTSYCNKNGQSNNAFSILGFFFWRENEDAMSWSFHPLADKTNNEHFPKPFFRVIRKSLYMYCNL